jgi:hypothetical protein
MRTWGVFLLGCWLIASSAVSLLQIRFTGYGELLALLMGAAGVLLLWERGRIPWRENLDLLLLGIWLVAHGVIGLFKFEMIGLGPLLSVIALVAGILLLRPR